METRLVPEAGFELVALPAQPRDRPRPAGARRRAGRARREHRCSRRARCAASAPTSCSRSAATRRCRPASPRVLLRRPFALVEANARPGRGEPRRRPLRAPHLRRVRGGGPRPSPGSAADAARPRHRPPAAARAGRRVPRRAAAPRTPAPPYRLFVFGGSQGARQINDAVLALLPQPRPGALRVGAPDRRDGPRARRRRLRGGRRHAPRSSPSSATWPARYALGRPRRLPRRRHDPRRARPRRPPGAARAAHPRRRRRAARERPRARARSARRACSTRRATPARRCARRSRRCSATRRGSPRWPRPRRALARPDAAERILAECRAAPGGRMTRGRGRPHDPLLRPRAPRALRRDRRRRHVRPRRDPPEPRLPRERLGPRTTARRSSGCAASASRCRSATTRAHLRGRRRRRRLLGDARREPGGAARPSAATSR